jgi:DDE superfamily endonuclease
LTPYIPYAWQPIGSAIEIPTSTHRRRLNVLGFLNRHNDLYPYVIEGKVDTPVIVECFDQFSKQINKRTYVLLDNSPLHRSQEFIRHIPQWVKRGLIIKYLPPYSPELNLIEILWRFIKYHWLPFSAYMSFPCLVQAIEDILTRFGTDYTINFQMKRVQKNLCSGT